MATTNIWKKFQSLLPQSSLCIGEVTEILGTRSRVRLRDGHSIIVNGATVEIGKMAQIVNGAIQSEAKNIPITSAEV